MSEVKSSLIPDVRRIHVVAWIEIQVDVEFDPDDTDVMESERVTQAVQDAIGHTGATVDFIERWSSDD